jgi:hypothetical protein
MPDAPENQGSQQGFQPVASQPAVPPYQYQPVAAPPPKQGSSALKIVLIIVGIFVGIGLIGGGIVAYSAYKVFKAVKMSANSSQPMTEGDLGVAIYPGSEPGKANLRMNIAGKSMVTANYTTSDSKDQVVAFYQNSLGPAVQSNATSNGETFILNKGSGETVTVTIAQNATMSDSKTQIVIVHASNAPSK